MFSFSSGSIDLNRNYFVLKFLFFTPHNVNHDYRNKERYSMHKSVYLNTLYNSLIFFIGQLLVQLLQLSPIKVCLVMLSRYAIIHHLHLVLNTSQTHPQCRNFCELKINKRFVKQTSFCSSISFRRLSKSLLLSSYFRSCCSMCCRQIMSIK